MKVGVSTSSFSRASPLPLERLTSAGVEYVPNPYGRRLTRDEAITFVADLDGLIAGLEPLDEGVLNSASKLKVIARVGIGMENVDQNAAQQLGIAVSNTPAPPTLAVAELTATAMLSLVRGFPTATLAMRGGEWAKEVVGSVNGATLLVVGLGRIGRQLVELVRPLGPTLIAADPFIAPNLIPAGVELVSLEDGLSRADIITLHAAGAKCIVGTTQFGMMKDGVILLNASRGPLVDEGALAEALGSGRVGAAWFDAFWEEPYTGSLLSHPNFYGTPHTGTYTRPCRLTMELEAVENMLTALGLANA